MHLPDPLTTPDFDLRGLEWMPLYGDRLFASDTWLEATPEGRCAALALWWASWKQCPAGSVPSSDRALAQLAGYGLAISAWAAIKDEVMRGWVRCSDDRYYHPVVCDLARISMKLRVEKVDLEKNRKTRQLRHRDERKKMFEILKVEGVTAPWDITTDDLRALFKKHKKHLNDVADTVAETSHETSLVTPETVTETSQVRLSNSPRTVTATANDRIGQDKERRSIPNTPYSAPPTAAPLTAREEFWSIGADLVRGLTGRAEKPTKQFLGLILKVLGDDCAAGLAIIREAVSLRPVEPGAWIMGAAKARRDGPGSVSVRDDVLASLQRSLDSEKKLQDYVGPTIDGEGEVTNGPNLISSENSAHEQVLFGVVT